VVMSPMGSCGSAYRQIRTWYPPEMARLTSTVTQCAKVAGDHDRVRGNREQTVTASDRTLARCAWPGSKTATPWVLEDVPMRSASSPR
jgi:hypothetical protein